MFDGDRSKIFHITSEQISRQIYNGKHISKEMYLKVARVQNQKQHYHNARYALHGT